MFKLKFQRRRGRMSKMQVALMACCASAIVLMHAVQLCYAAEPATPAAAGNRSGKIETVNGNSLFIIVPAADLQTLKVDENVKVNLAGAKSKWEDLKKGDFFLDAMTLAPADGAHGGEGKITLKKAGPVDSLTMVFGEDSKVIKVRPTTKVDVSGEVIDWAKVQAGSYVVTQIIASKPNQFAYDLSQAKITLNGAPASAKDLRGGDSVKITPSESDPTVAAEVTVTRLSIGAQFFENFRKNLFKPLLLFFYMGFVVPLLGIAFEFPHVIYQGLTIYLLVAIGWHGGEELADLTGAMLQQALMFMVLGFATNFFIGIFAYGILRVWTKLRRVDAATVAAYYGSDSAGTFVTCVGVLTAANIAYAAYMPVMLAVMEIPGCLVGLFIVSQLRRQGMDPLGNMPDEPGYDPKAKPIQVEAHGHGGHGNGGKAVEREKEMALEDNVEAGELPAPIHPKSAFNAELLKEVFLNPGLFLLFGGIVVGFVSRMQGHKVTDPDDSLFITLFQGLLCLFLLEMGMTACRRLKDLRTAGWRFIVYGLVAPNVFATTGMLIAHGFSLAIGQPLELGTYVLFAVLCGAASYIAVPAVQRLAIPEASPTLPLAASLGLTFSYNVTIGIPVYIEIAKALMGSGVPGG
jgi:hypothetical protein